MIRYRKAGDLGVVEVRNQAQHAAQRLADGVEARLVAIGAALAVAGNGAVDQFGIQLRQLFVVETKPFPRRRAEIFDQDVRRLQEFQQDLPSFLLSSIQRDALLVTVQSAEARAVTLVLRNTAAMRIAAAQQLDLDDLATKITEQAARIGTGDMAADVDTNCSVESS